MADLRDTLKGLLAGTVLATGGSWPGKLSDCTTAHRADSELFVVEGDSAGGIGEAGARPRTWKAALRPRHHPR